MAVWFQCSHKIVVYLGECGSHCPLSKVRIKPHIP